MRQSPALAGVAALEPVGLDEVEATAPLQTRVERKYLLTAAQAATFLERVHDRAGVLDIGGRREFAYESVYFDTPGLRSYLDAVRSRPRRFKVRTRTYVETGSCFVEVKLRRNREHTVKHRRDHDPELARVLTPDALAFVGGFTLVQSCAGELRATLVTRYQRVTLVVGTTRVTLDVGLHCEADGHGSARLEEVVVVETKSDAAAGDADRVLWSAGLRPAAFSKYGVGTAVLDSRLPRNKWHRTINRLRWDVEAPA